MPLRRFPRFTLPWRSAERVARDLDDELAFYLDMRAQELAERGMAPDEARRAARAEFGDLEFTRRYCRALDLGGERASRRRLWLDDLRQDVALAWRGLRRSPGYAAVALLTLALGIGAATAIFTVVDGVWLGWTGAFERPERLVMVFKTSGDELIPTTPADFRDWRARGRAFEGIAAYHNRGIVLSTGDEPRQLTGAAVAPGMFELLRVRPALGRVFRADEETWGRHRVAILSHGLWRREFGASPAIVGSVLRIDGEPHEVVGVMPPGAWPGTLPVEIWVPMAFAPDDRRNSRNSHFIWSVARLADGVTLERANAELAALARALAREFPQNEGASARAEPLRDIMLGDVEPTMLLLAAAVGLVLLIACANVANLLLARGAARGRELAVRAALGASRGRLVRQLLTECLVLALAGGTLGLGLAALGVRAAVAALPVEMPRIHETGLALDGRVLGFTLALATGTALLFGLLPSLRAGRAALGDGLRDGARGATGGARGRRLRDGLVVAEVVLAVVLLAGAGLLLRSLVRLQQVEVGASTDDVLVAYVGRPRASTAEADRATAFYERLLERVRALPGVRAAGVTSAIPLDGGGQSKSFWIEGRPPARKLAEVAHVSGRQESAGSLEAMGVALRRGRWFTPADDSTAPRVALISESVARRFFPNDDPIGQRISLAPPEHLWPASELPPGGRFPRWTVVGVVGDVKYEGLRAEPEMLVYTPHLQRAPEWTWGPGWLVVRASGDPASLGDAVRRAVRALDPDQPVAAMQTLGERVDAALRQPRFLVALVGAFAAAALVLGAVGLYGVIAYAVAQETPAIGVRMALGARPRDVLAMVLGRAAGLAGLGVVVGLAAALALGRVMASLLFGVGARDGVTLAGTGVVVLVVALAAALVPARRAARVDPAVALRGG